MGIEAEQQRLLDEAARRANWKRWGTYLPERQWGTVREDYSANGDSWHHFPHDHARSRAYRWGEDGLLGFCDRQCRLCFAPALWNGADPMLKERLFGLTGPEGNHGEDVKELYYYLDATPTHAYARALYKYPRRAFPYAELVEENGRRGHHDPEYELLDTNAFDDGHFDLLVTYAKAAPDDILVELAVTNHSDATARLDVLPTLWFRNTWIWGCEHEGCTLKPRIWRLGERAVGLDHETLGRFTCRFSEGPAGESPVLLFTENETNARRLHGRDTYTPYVKDAFHEAIVHGVGSAVNPEGKGTKCAAHYRLELAPGAQVQLRCRLVTGEALPPDALAGDFEQTLKRRREEADAFYAKVGAPGTDADTRLVERQAYAGMLWSKQFYHYSVNDWLRGDEAIGAPPAERRRGRNVAWRHHLFNRDVISMPDKWEYPWYAAWDLAFHTLTYARIDPDFAKGQLVLMLREWYMHPNGQLPAYEFAFDDVNPPVHAWACWRVYRMTGPRGARDVTFLKRVFHKLLMNFTWWVNRKDPEGNNLFAGGFLGLDNIGVFDRLRALPTGGKLNQADGTAWMAFYCTTMLAIALELAEHDSAYEDVASKFFEHFVAISDAMNHLGGSGLWDDQDGFYYDQLRLDGREMPLRIRSMVGLIPLFAVLVLEQRTLDRLPDFRKRMDWFLAYRGDLARQVSYMECRDHGIGRYLLAIPSRERLERVLQYVVSEAEFLSPYGLRSLSRYHADHPYTFDVNGEQHRVAYTPAESDSGMFGGNSNWRGPIWFPLNMLVIEALDVYHYYYGNSLVLEYPAGSGERRNLGDIARDLSARLVKLFQADENGRRPCHGDERRYDEDPAFRDLLLFHEYFHGDNGRGVGASHQTGWTGLVANLMRHAARKVESSDTTS